MTTLVWLGFAQASLIFDRQELLLLNPTKQTMGEFSPAHISKFVKMLEKFSLLLRSIIDSVFRELLRRRFRGTKALQELSL
ncbi:MAG: hypothetical protein GPJ16_15465 [Microcystis aeruginosa G11-04]|uniref:Uncharacterized protein n=1 Tax=Microcystis aeruginosa G11-04 TaxID=2685956 RepID=A0A966G0T0_MICAE|nr:hypothetical protein [Microcystis aeruginosa G11-04]